MSSSRPSDEDDGNEETVGLLTSTDDSSAPPRSTNNKEIRMKRAQLQKASRLRPLEVLHSSSHRRLEDQRAAARACQSGFAIFFLSVLIGLWIWSGQQVSQHTSIQRWHNLRLSDIQHWCLDVSVGMMFHLVAVSLSKSLTQLIDFRNRKATTVYVPIPWSQRIVSRILHGNRPMTGILEMQLVGHRMP